MSLRASQLETLRFIAKYTDGAGAWELAEFGPGGDSIKSAVLTDKGREAIR